MSEAGAKPGLAARVLVCERSPSYHERILLSVLDAIEALLAGKIDVVALQSKLVSSEAALDHSVGDILNDLQRLDGELELVRFGVHEADQREQVDRLLEPLAIRVRATLEGRGAT